MAKILYIVESLDNGAVESWLLNCFEEIDKIAASNNITFFCILNHPGKNEFKAKQLGINIIHSPFKINQKINFLKFLRKEIKEGKYDFIHSQHDLMSGFYFIAVLGLPVKRIIHVHNFQNNLPTGNKLINLIMREFFYWLCMFLSFKIVGVSKQALVAFTRNRYNKKSIVMYCGVDFTLFNPELSKMDLRKELGLEENAILLLFVGRLDKFKNPAMLVHILNEMIKNNSKIHYHLIYAGKGPESDNIHNIADSYGLTSNVHMLGFRTDLPNIYKNADVFLFPRLESLPEGLGLVIVEAQAAGIPIVTTKAIPTDAFVCEDLIQILSTGNNYKIWAQAISHAVDLPKKDKTIYYNKINISSFNISHSSKELMNLYV